MEILGFIIAVIVICFGEMGWLGPIWGCLGRIIGYGFAIYLAILIGYVAGNIILYCFILLLLWQLIKGIIRKNGRRIWCCIVGIGICISSLLFGGEGLFFSMTIGYAAFFIIFTYYKIYEEQKKEEEDNNNPALNPIPKIDKNKVILGDENDTAKYSKLIFVFIGIGIAIFVFAFTYVYVIS